MPWPARFTRTLWTSPAWTERSRRHLKKSTGFTSSSTRRCQVTRNRLLATTLSASASTRSGRRLGRVIMPKASARIWWTRRSTITLLQSRPRRLPGSMVRVCWASRSRQSDQPQRREPVDCAEHDSNPGRGWGGLGNLVGAPAVHLGNRGVQVRWHRFWFGKWPWRGCNRSSLLTLTCLPLGRVEQFLLL